MRVYREVFDGSRRHNYESLGELCETIQAAYGTGENNTPIVVEVYEDKREVVGFDVYNQAVTGEVSKTLTNIKTDADHVPTVFVLKE